MTPKHKSSNVDNLDMPKTSHKVLPVDNVEVLTYEEKTSCMLRLLKSTTVRMNFLSVKVL